MTSSDEGLPKKPPPLAPMTTYCLPSRPMYVLGIECAGAGSLSDQSTLPLRASKARKYPSIVAPMNTRLPAVVMAPPELGVPVWMPFAASSSKSPSGTCHAMSPVLALTATSSPHGGAVQLHRLAGSQNRPPSGVAFESA